MILWLLQFEIRDEINVIQNATHSKKQFIQFLLNVWLVRSNVSIALSVGHFFYKKLFILIQIVCFVFLCIFVLCVSLSIFLTHTLSKCVLRFHSIFCCCCCVFHESLFVIVGYWLYRQKKTATLIWFIFIKLVFICFVMLLDIYINTQYRRLYMFPSN